MNTIREIEKINQQELDRGIAGTNASWHSQFANSAWVYVGNLDHQLTEGDVLCVMSQYGEIEDIHLVREEDTGKSRGFAFLKYEDVQSCILAVDNFCGVMVLGRSIRVDHVEQYRLPKKLQEEEASKTAGLTNGVAGHAYKDMELENKYNVHQGMDLFAPPSLNVKNDNDKDRNKNRVKSDKKLEKIKRKVERQRKRQEKEERQQRREERREKHEEKRRRKRARKYHDHRNDDRKDKSNHHTDNEEESRDGSRNEKYHSDASVNGEHRETERKGRKRGSHKDEKKKKKHRRSN